MNSSVCNTLRSNGADLKFRVSFFEMSLRYFSYLCMRKYQTLFHISLRGDSPLCQAKKINDLYYKNTIKSILCIFCHDFLYNETFFSLFRWNYCFWIKYIHNNTVNIKVLYKGFIRSIIISKLIKNSKKLRYSASYTYYIRNVWKDN